MKLYPKLAFCLLLLTLPLIAQPTGSHASPAPTTVVHNGRWWEEKSGLYREAFVGGYKAGAKITAGHAVDINKFSSNDLVDGLDHFYKDYRNHNILIEDALHFVQEQLSGVPDDKLAAEALKMRAAAAPTVVD